MEMDGFKLYLFNTYIYIKIIRIKAKIICYFTMIVQVRGVSRHFGALNLQKFSGGHAPGRH